MEPRTYLVLVGVTNFFACMTGITQESKTGFQRHKLSDFHRLSFPVIADVTQVRIYTVPYYPLLFHTASDEKLDGA